MQKVEIRPERQDGQGENQDFLQDVQFEKHRWLMWP